MQRYGAYYKNDFGDKLGAMLERSENGDLVLYDDAIDRELVLREALNRAAELLSATADFIRINPVKEYTVHYDETDCDGSCLKDDCEIALEQARAALGEIE